MRLIALLFLLLPVAALADGGDDAARAAKFRVAGDEVIYDTETIPDVTFAEIESDDHEELLRLLRLHPEIRRIRLNSQGGRVYGGFRMADIVIDFGLDTVVDGTCNSSCLYILLGGANREMTGGSRIGFHHRSWGASDIQSYYDRWRRDEGWTTLFDFAAWLFVDSQNETYEELQYYLERGVSGAFAIEAMRVREDGLWYPRRSELIEAGVLTR